MLFHGEGLFFADGRTFLHSFPFRLSRLPYLYCAPRRTHAGVLIPRLVPQFAALPVALGPTQTYWLTRSVFLRCLGGIFAVAFSVALAQNKALIGDQVGL